MWSVWSERIDLYLGGEFAVLKTKRQGERVIPLAPGVPMNVLLKQLAQEMAQLGIANKRWQDRLSITLGGGLCQAFAFTTPPAVKRWDETQIIARGCAASASGASVDNIVCETDASHAGVVASMSRSLLEEVELWAKQQHCKLVSVQPLWAAASQCPAARAPSVKGVLVQEPDAVTVVAQGQDGKHLASTLVRSKGPHEADMQLRRWLVGLGLSQSNLLKLGFDASVHPAMKQCPGVWAGHWTLGPEVL